MYDTEIDTVVNDVMDAADAALNTLPLDAYCEALDDILNQLGLRRMAADDDKRARAQGD